MKHVLLAILFCISINAFACSSKDQLSITVNTVKESNFPHKEYVKLGKKLFNDDLLSNQLHSYSASINHSSGTIVFDIANDQIKKQILTKMKDILTQQDLHEIRITHNKLQKI
ncbi:hypothetical protein [Francisella tularensis]|uniref:hypothetical protein n=1 Tax=Francisella tularensis TaxID=263 RepID=UPI0008F501D4|nr:hypothetical protein [Francisella tularensis]APA82147.1 hypothetical protein N894_0163 [Francisella tularensis subsp. novicida PA10-7858]